MNKQGKKIKITVSEIIHRSGGQMVVAIGCNVSQLAVVQWENRKSIPQKFWNYFVENKYATLEELFIARNR